MRVFRLFAFSDSRITVITRGETQEQAMRYACRDDGAFPRGVTVFPLDYLPINASELYSKNHSYGWLYRAPIWLANEEYQQAIKKGVPEIISDALDALRQRAMLP